MSVSLQALIENNIGFEANHTFAKQILQKIKELNFPAAINHDGSKDDAEYQYFIDETKEGNFSIDIETPTPYAYEIRKNSVVISSIYRYSFIYESNTIDWFQRFRKDLFEIVTLFKAKELIFVSGNVKNLSFYIDDVYNNKSYTFIKEVLTKKFRSPITDYKSLNYDSLDYDNINEWFLETFHDLTD